MICPFMRYAFICPFYQPFHNIDRASPCQCTGRIKNQINVKTTEKKYNTPYIKADLKIPVFSGNVNPNIIRNINENIENDIMEFKDQIESGAQQSLGGMIQSGKKVNPYAISNTFQVVYNQNGLLSVLVTYAAIIGGVSNYVKASYNYDLRTGKPIALGDLFKNGIPYKSLLNTEIKKQLQTNNDKYIKSAAAKFTGVADDQPFYMDGDGIEVFLGFNESAPFAGGIPLIKVPYASLSNALKQSMGVR